MTTTIKTRVGIVGAGRRLMLSHLLAKSGIDNVAIDTRPRQEIETTHRAGILEDGVVKTIVKSGVGDRVHTDGYEHHGIELRFDRAGHRIDFTALVGATCWLYPQTTSSSISPTPGDGDGGDVRFGVKDTQVSGVDGDSPLIRFVDADGTECEIQCEVVAGTDGSRSICRFLIPENQRVHYFKEYPFAWFGVLSEVTVQRAGADLRALRTGIRVDQSAHRGDPAAVLPVPDRRGRRAVVEPADLGRAAGSGRRR